MSSTALSCPIARDEPLRVAPRDAGVTPPGATSPLPANAAAREPWPVSGAADDWRAVLRDVLGEEPRCVLEAGCGSGDLALVLQGLGHVVRGIDASPEAVRAALEKAHRHGARLDLRCARAEDLPFADESLDVVVAHHLLWDLPAPEAAVREWMRVLRPGGVVLVLESRWVAEPATRVGDAVARLVPGAALVARRPTGSPLRPAPLPHADAARDFLASMGLQRAMVLDLACLRNASWPAVPALARWLLTPRSVHYAAWGMRA